LLLYTETRGMRSEITQKTGLLLFTESRAMRGMVSIGRWK
jgi:hypothetical protein